MSPELHPQKNMFSNSQVPTPLKGPFLTWHSGCWQCLQAQNSPEFKRPVLLGLWTTKVAALLAGTANDISSNLI